jgi:hypothetical protein
MRPRLRRAGGGEGGVDAARGAGTHSLAAAAAAALSAGGAALSRAADAAARALSASAGRAARRAPPAAPQQRQRTPAFASLSASLAADDAPARLTRRRQRGGSTASPLVFVSAASELSGLQPANAARTQPAPSDADAADADSPDADSADADAPADDATSGGAGGPPAPAPREERILISEVEIKGVSGELAALAQAALTIKPNFAYTLEEVQEDVNRVFQTGYFSNCQPLAEDTRDGVRVTLDVRPNPELRGVVVNGANVLPVRVIADAFGHQARPQKHFAPKSGFACRASPALR